MNEERRRKQGRNRQTKKKETMERTLKQTKSKAEKTSKLEK